MDKLEKILFLEVLLKDIRVGWGIENNTFTRAEIALVTAIELGFDRHIERVKNFRDAGDVDGTIFEVSYDYGGYIGMSDLHGLDYNLKSKSYDFRLAIEKYINWPEHIFDNIEE